MNYDTGDDTAVERPLRPLAPEETDERLDPVALATGYHFLTTDQDI